VPHLRDDKFRRLVVAISGVLSDSVAATIRFLLNKTTENHFN